MRNRVLKALAAFGLSVCVLAGSAVAGMAEGTPSEKADCTEHVWKTTTEYQYDPVETTFRHQLPDGTVETLKLCPDSGKEDGTARLKKVNGAFSNFSGLEVYSGALKNGEQVMTVAFYYPTTIRKVVCEKCGLVKSETTTPARFMASPVEASIELPASAVEGHTLMLIRADGTESPVELSRNETTGKVSFKLDLTSGAQLLRLAADS